MASPRRALSEPWDRQALCFFMSDRSIVPRHLVIDKVSITTIVTPVCIDTRNDSALMSILSSISLFSLSHIPGHESLAIDAEQHYGLAVSRLNKAIADPVACKRNDTLLCVLLFQLRETITMTDSSLATWRQHSDGVLALCKIRGSPRNILEQRLYTTARDLMMTRRIRDLERIPQHEVRSLWIPWQLDKDPYQYERLAESSLEIPNLRAKAYKLLHRPMDAYVARALFALLAEAKRLDLQTSTWPIDLPPCALYKTLFTYTGPRPAHKYLSKLELWPGAIDFYEDVASAHTWNTYRIYRALVSMVVVNCAERLYPAAELKNNTDYSEAVQVIRAMVDDICASVPYILHSSRISRENASSVLLSAAHLRFENARFSSNESHHVRHVTPEPSKSVYFSDAHVPISIPNCNDSHGSSDDKGHAWVGLGGMPLVNSLYAASTLFCVPKEQRVWIRSRLRVIAESFNLDHAKVLEDLGAKAEKQNKLDEEIRVDRVSTITDMAPLPWVEWRKAK